MYVIYHLDTKGYHYWLPIESRLRFKIALLTYKVRSMPLYLSSIISTKRSTGYSLRSLCAPQLTVPRVETEFARRTFCVAAPQVWNDLPVNVLSSQVSQSMFLNQDSKLFFLI